ncbi:MAG: hypothetical protein QXT19_02480 [Candidatus Woesearchaeota archaeon]
MPEHAVEVDPIAFPVSPEMAFKVRCTALEYAPWNAERSGWFSSQGLSGCWCRTRALNASLANFLASST